jgi:hypothetical protein
MNIIQNVTYLEMVQILGLLQKENAPQNKENKQIRFVQMKYIG